MNQIDAIEQGLAPRMAAGWEAILSVLADGAWHEWTELVAVAVGTGLAEGSGDQLLKQATYGGRLDRENRAVKPTRWRWWYRLVS